LARRSLGEGGYDASEICLLLIHSLPLIHRLPRRSDHLPGGFPARRVLWPLSADSWPL